MSAVPPVGRQHILVTGGAGYIGSHAAYALREAGYVPVVVDNLVTGNVWAVKFGPFEQGDVGDTNFIRNVCERYQPIALMHFAAFIEVGESVKNPQKYTQNNYEKAGRLFETIHACGLRHAVFSSTAAVYGEVTSTAPLREDLQLQPINPYGQSKLDAETYLRTFDGKGLKSVTFRYFNAAGAAAAEIGIGEAHAPPESHVIPRLVLPLLPTDPAILAAHNLSGGFKIFGDDYPTADGTAVRDYIHVTDLALAHVAGLNYLLAGGDTEIFNLGSGAGYSVRQVVDAAKQVLGNTAFNPEIVARRQGDPAILIADNSRARAVLGWEPHLGLPEIIASAAQWHQTKQYLETMRARMAQSANAIPIDAVSTALGCKV